VLDAATELRLDYDVTILPPKKYFLPQAEAVLSYVPKDAGSYKAETDASSRVLIGVHPYDLAGIRLLDQAFLEDKRDANYAARRENTILIGIYPVQPFKYRFAVSAGTATTTAGADAMLCDLGGAYGIELLTAKGKAFFGAAATEDKAVADTIAKARTKAADGQKLSMETAKLPAYLDGKMQSPLWKEKGEMCYSCGSCVMVCPTCYCFNMREDVDLSLAKGRRVREWDGCVLEGFALVAGGHNFRTDKATRFRHRFYRKAKYLPEKFGTFGCVGCGRCADACTAGIANPVEIVDALQKES
jgi:formate hydrogenlyase subunit 6/NADH:ubiquinone oxidoreductase subunit I